MNIKSNTYTIVDGVECKECQGKYLKRWKTANAARAKAIVPVEEYPCRLCKSFSRTVNDKRTGYCMHYHHGVKVDYTCGYWRPDTTLKFKV